VGQVKGQYLAKERREAVGGGAGPSSFNGYKLWDWPKPLAAASPSLSSGSFLEVTNVSPS